MLWAETKTGLSLLTCASRHQSLTLDIDLTRGFLQGKGNGPSTPLTTVLGTLNYRDLLGPVPNLQQEVSGTRESLGMFTLNGAVFHQLLHDLLLLGRKVHQCQI